MMRHPLLHIAYRWCTGTRGAALPEFALLFPIIMALLMGSYDIGRALTINQKVISSSQVIADLITRQQTITMDTLDDIILAGELAIDPYSREPFGYDIIGIRYTSNGAPSEQWRITENMTPDDDIIDRAIDLGGPGEGVIAVTTSYTYRPFFTGFLTDDIAMRETAILRGRRAAYVSCLDC